MPLGVRERVREIRKREMAKKETFVRCQNRHLLNASLAMAPSPHPRLCVGASIHLECWNSAEMKKNAQFHAIRDFGFQGIPNIYLAFSCMRGRLPAILPFFLSVRSTMWRDNAAVAEERKKLGRIRTYVFALRVCLAGLKIAGACARGSE